MTDVSGSKNVVVVGGGLSGLSAGLEVRRIAAEKGLAVNVTVLERNERVGGKIGSVRKDGFLCETGPNGFLDNKPATMALVNRIGVEDKLLKSNDEARKRYVFWRRQAPAASRRPGELSHLRADVDQGQDKARHRDVSPAGRPHGGRDGGTICPPSSGSRGTRQADRSDGRRRLRG